MRFIVVLIALLQIGCSSSLPFGGHFSQGLQLGQGKEWRHDPVLVDINNDGLTDIVATHRKPLYENSLHIWLAEGSGKWKELPQSWVSPGYSGIDVGDLNGDGRADIIAGSHFNRIHALIRKDKENFENFVLSTEDGYAAAAIRDLDSDGKAEAILLGNEFAGTEIYNFVDQKLVLKTSLLPGYIGRDLQIADMNKDGRADIVVSVSKLGVVIFFQQADGSWQQSAATGFESETKEFRSMRVGDLNNDGWPDIVLNGGYSGIARLNGPDVYLSAGARGGWIPASADFKIFKKPAEGIAIGDFNGDKAPDIIAGGNLSNSVRGDSFGLFVFLGNGKGEFALMKNSGLSENGMFRPYGIVTADLNRDGKYDIVSLHSDPEGDGGSVNVIVSR